MGGAWRSISVALRADASGYLGPVGAAAAATRKLGDETDRAAKKSSSGWTSLSKAVKVGVAGMVLAVGAFIGASINAAAEFESRMSAIGAVSGATAGEMDLLREKALQLGADTSFSASEAASAMEELVKAGVSVEGVLNGAADATVALAAAGEIALPEAAAIAANAMNQFNLAAEDLPHIADLIAGAANASAIDVSEFGMSMSQAGAVANLVGLSFDDTALAITAMGNAGIKSSDAGTSLKTFLTNLVPSTDKASGLMADLGIITKEAGNRFFDASGEVKSMADISDVLAESLAGMSREQQIATLNTLFGSDAIRAAAIIAGEGAAGFKKLSDQVGKVTAAEVAAERMDNLKGSVEQLKGSVETLMIQVGSKFTPFLRDAADAGTDMVNALSSGDTAGTVLDPILDAAKRLEPFWHGLVDTGGNLVEILGDVYDVGAPIAGLLAKMVTGAAIVGLNTLATALEAVTGFLADNTGLVQGLTYALIGLGAVQAVELLATGALAATSAFLKVQAAIKGTAAVSFASGIISQLGLIGTGLVTMGTNATVGFGMIKAGAGGIVSALAGPQVAIAAFAALAAVSYLAIKDAQKDVNDEIDRMAENVDRTNPRALADLARSYQDQARAAREAVDQESRFGGALKGTVEVLTPMENTVLRNQEALRGFNKAMVSTAEEANRLALRYDLVRITLNNLRSEDAPLELSMGDSDITAWADKLNLDPTTMMVTDLAAAIDTARSAAANGTPATDELAASYASVATETADATDRLNAFKDILDALIGKPKSLFDANTAYAKSVGELSAAFVEYGGNIDATTEGGQALRASLSGIVDDSVSLATAMYDNGSSAEEATNKLRLTAIQIAQMGEAAGLTRPQIDELLTSLGLTEDTFTATLGIDDPGDAQAQADAINDALAGVDSTDATATVRLDVDNTDFKGAGFDTIGEMVGFMQDQNPEMTAYLDGKPFAASARDITSWAATYDDSTPTAQALLNYGPAQLGFSTLSGAAAFYEALDPATTARLNANPASVSFNELQIRAAQWRQANPLTSVFADTSPAERKLIELMRPRTMTVQVYAQKLGDWSSLGQYYGSAGGGKDRRWGAVHSYAKGGIHAHVQQGEAIRYAEPETGGEAFIPRLGDPARNFEILSIAAGWQGMTVVPKSKQWAMAAGGTTTMQRATFTPVGQGGGTNITVDMRPTFHVTGNGDSAFADMLQRQVVPAIAREADKVVRVLTKRSEAMSR